jgi:hypothetical protein
MLPDLPKLKLELQSIFHLYLRNQINLRLGVFNQSPRHIIHEGKEMRTSRADGSVVETELKSASTEMTIKHEEIPTLSFDERVRRLNLLAEDMARQMSEHFFGTLKDDLEKSGQVVDRKGKPLDAEAIFEMIEKIQFDFDGVDETHNISIVIPPNLQQRMKEVMMQIETDPSLRKRHDEIMAKKRMEWRDREAARKLVG